MFIVTGAKCVCVRHRTIVRVLPYPYMKPKKQNTISAETPCRQVRQAMGVSQEKFAEFLGVAKQTVVDIEGRRKGYGERIPWNRAKRIALMSGADPRSLVDQTGTARGMRCVILEGREVIKTHVGPDGRKEWHPYVEERQILPEAYSRSDFEIWAGGGDMGEAEVNQSIAGNVSRRVASAIIAAEQIGVLQGRFLAQEIEDVIMSHVSAWSARNAPARTRPPEVVNDEARKNPHALNIGPVMGEHSRAVAKLKAAGLPSGGAEILSPAFLIELATMGEAERHQAGQRLSEVVNFIGGGAKARRGVRKGQTRTQKGRKTQE